MGIVLCLVTPATGRVGAAVVVRKWLDAELVAGVTSHGTVDGLVVTAVHKAVFWRLQLAAHCKRRGQGQYRQYTCHKTCISWQFWKRCYYCKTMLANVFHPTSTNCDLVAPTHHKLQIYICDQIHQNQESKLAIQLR